MKVKPFFFLMTLSIFSCKEESPSVILPVEAFSSEFIGERNIQIYLPPGYHSSDYKFPVLYMHDGQMLYDSTTTWNGQEWGVDEVIDREIATGTIRPAIVVGIWNGGIPDRHREYFPQKPFESLDSVAQDSILTMGRESGHELFSGPIKSDDYLRFLVEELKPWVDETHRTLPDRANTFIMGSSMGGLISMYALCEYPEVFGGVACMSTHWPGIFQAENNPIPDAFADYLKHNLPAPGGNRIYFDYGTETLDAMYEPFQLRVDEVMQVRGYGEENWITQKFEGHQHDERSWNKRLFVPLRFLLGLETKD